MSQRTTVITTVTKKTEVRTTTAARASSPSPATKSQATSQAPSKDLQFFCRGMFRLVQEGKNPKPVAVRKSTDTRGKA